MMRNRFLIKSAHLALLLAVSTLAGTACADDEYSSLVNKADAQSSAAGAKGAAAVVAAGIKTPAAKTITNFSQALRCMDELFLQYDKKGIVITSAGIPDETGKAKVGSKEMLITAISKMTLKSGAFDFIDFHSAQDDLGSLFNTEGNAKMLKPDFYIRGSVTQMDDNAVRTNKGIGIALPFLDLGASKDVSYDVLSMDMSVGVAATRRILPETSTSNTMVITKTGKSGEAGGKLAKLGLSFNMDLSQSEGIGAASRTLMELGLIETLGKFTRVPYWRCLDADSTNPAMMAQAQDWFETAKKTDLVLFVQRKLAGMNRYRGALDGVMNPDLKTSIEEYQAAASLTADGRINFELYYSLLDDVQNQLAAVPAEQHPVPVAATAPASVPFAVNLDTDRGKNPQYRPGDTLALDVSVTTPGAVYCYYEDASHHTARIFPNQFNANSMLQANSKLHLPGAGFKIKFDHSGTEKIACMGSNLEVVVPGTLNGFKDLVPLPTGSLEDVVRQFKASNPSLAVAKIEMTVR
jgi:hypothetical protein